MALQGVTPMMKLVVALTSFFNLGYQFGDYTTANGEKH